MSFVYQPGIPTGIVNLDIDYLNIQGNFQQANIVYGTDHYPFNNATPNQGFHNQVTTPIYVANPVTGLPPVTTTNPIFYAFQQYPALGVLQYSRGPSNAVPTPLTSINSPDTGISLAPGARTNVLDFTGFSFAIANLYILDAIVKPSPDFRPGFSTVYWSNGSFTVFSGGVLKAVNTGNILQIQNDPGNVAVTNVFWTLELVRVK